MTSFKLTLRQLWQRRLFTGLNILGLAIGISACWIIFRIVNYEFSFDKSHPEGEHIYQVGKRTLFENKESGFAGVPLPVAPYIMETFDDLEEVVPVYERYYEIVAVDRKNNDPFRVDEQRDIVSTVPAYFDMVPYTWLAGSKDKAIAQPKTVVLTHSRAAEYFPKKEVDDIIGQTIAYDSTLFTITGIVADLDKPSSFAAKEFMPIPADEITGGNWMSSNSAHLLYLKLQPSQKAGFLRALNAKSDEVNAEEYKKYKFRSWYVLAPLKEKHFNQEYAAGAYSAKKSMTYSLIGVGIFLALLAAINYINLSTAQVPHRAKEIGIRKTLGERNGRLTLEFLRQTLFICCCALLLAFPFVKFFQYFFQDFMPPGISNFNDDTAVALFLAALVFVLTLFSGLYPAYLINKVNIADVIKINGLGKLSLGNLSLRKILIVFQFVIAQVFVIGAFIVASQINYMMNTDLGFEKNAVITIKLPYKSYQNAEVNPFLYKQELENRPEIAAISLGHLPLDNNHWGNSLIAKSDTGEVQLNLAFKYVDPNYLKVYGIKTLAGRSPLASDTADVVFLNESARARLGFKSNDAAVGQQVSNFDGVLFTVAGIFNDFHQKNLHNEKESLAIRVSQSKQVLQAFNIRLANSPKDWPRAIALLEKEWKHFYPNAPFTYNFYDDEIKSLYESDIKQARIINLATGVTIILSCLGLIGLVTLTAYQRTKEIGIRKVLGSSVINVIALLAKDYIQLVGIAILIACPIAWWGMRKWLEDFAYRIEIQWWMLLLTGIITILIAFLSVSYQALKAARANPIDSLRDE